MTTYKCLDNSMGYERVLTVGNTYQGAEESGIFASDPYLRVFDDNGNQITTAHLSRFERVTDHNGGQ